MSAPQTAPHGTADGDDPLQALLDASLDLILAELPGPDEHQPGEWIAQALTLQKQSGLYIPLIVIANPAYEAQAAAFLDAGAADYLCSDRLQRLCAAVRRAVYPRTDAYRLKEQARYQLLFEHARDIFLFVRLNDGRILEANRTAEKAYGYTRSELLEMNIADLRAPETRALIEEQTRSVSSTIDDPNGNGMVFETWHQHKDGTVFPVEVNSLGADIDGAKVSMSIIHNISQRKVAERGLERRMSELEALHDVAQAGTEANSLDELIERVVHIVQQCLFPDEFGVAFLDEAKGALTYHPTSFTQLPYREHSLPVATGISGSVARSGKPRRESDLRQCSDVQPADLPVLSELCVPLVVANQVVGVLNAESVVPNYFSASDERLLVAVAGELATAMEKIRLLEAERARRQELESLAQISAVVRVAETRADMLPAILTEMQKVLDADGATIAMIDQPGDMMVFEAGVGCWERNHGVHIPLGQGPGSQAVATRQMVSVDQETGPDQRPGAYVFPVRCVLCLPLIAHDTVIGLLYAGRNTPFRPSDIRLANATADIIASAFDRVRLFAKTRQQLERLTALRAIDHSILASPDLDQTLTILMDSITGLLGVDAADILLNDPRHQVLLVAAERGMPPRPILPKKVAFENTHAGQVALQRKMEFIPDLEKGDASLARRLKAIGAHFTSYLALPLIAKDTVKGVVEIYQHERLDPSAEWMDFLQALTDQAAIAIDNALLFKDQQQTNERLKEAYEDTIDGWSRALDMRDKETEGHSQRVTELTMRLAQRLGMTEEQLAHIRRGAQLHDIGKMGIPDSILLKPGPLTAEEWDIMREHPLYALDFLYSIDFLTPAMEIPYCHHEKWDGSGYPQGLRGEMIPLAARIFAIVDVWDALTSTRPYRPAWPAEQALDYIREQAGIHFDPQILEHFLAVLAEEADPTEGPPPDA